MVAAVHPEDAWSDFVDPPSAPRLQGEYMHVDDIVPLILPQVHRHINRARLVGFVAGLVLGGLGAWWLL